MTNEIEEVEVMQVGQVFHLVTQNPMFANYRRRMIPKELWDLYTEIQPQAVDVSRQIEMYFRPVKDVPMEIAKNHQDDGTI